MSAASVVAPSAAAAPSAAPEPINTDPIEYMQYAGERQLQGIIDLISVDLSEPYSVFTYRYFINNWPNLCYLAVVPAKAEADAEGPAREERVVGCIVCKQDAHRTTHAMRGYIAMLAVRTSPAGRRTRLLGSPPRCFDGSPRAVCRSAGAQQHAQARHGQQAGVARGAGDA